MPGYRTLPRSDLRVVQGTAQPGDRGAAARHRYQGGRTSALTVDDLDARGARASVFVRKRGPRIARRVPIDAFALEIVSGYAKARAALSPADGLLFMATAGGKPMKPATLGQCVRSALRDAGAAAADESPRLLRNTYGRRHLPEGKTNEQVSSLMGLSSHRTAKRLRETIHRW